MVIFNSEDDNSRDPTLLHNAIKLPFDGIISFRFDVRDSQQLELHIATLSD